MASTINHSHLQTLKTNQLNLNITHNTNTAPKSNQKLLNIFYVNIRSLKNKFTDLKHTLEKDKISYHIIIIIETWLKKDETRFYEMDNYNMHNSVRMRDGGGITIYTHNSLHTNLQYEYTDENNHFIVTHIHKYNLKIAALYNTRNNTFLPQLESILQNNSKCLIFGDINIDLLNYNNVLNSYIDIIDSNGYAILNKLNSNYCTRIANNSKSIIDHILTDKYNYKYLMSINSQCYTDHESITLQIDHKSLKTTPIQHII